MKKDFFLNFSLKYKFSYKLYLVYNLYIRNLKYLLKKKYSQCGEDIFLQNYFNKKKGFFIDIGCHHPFRYNNTFRLYNLGWKGINIDLSRISIDLFNLMRPLDTNICSAISNKIGFINYYIPNHNPLSPEITTDYNFVKKYKKLHKSLYSSHKIDCVNWSFLEKKYKKILKKVDLLKIDIEGSDFKILKTINIKKLKPTLLMVEAPSFEISLRKKLIRFLKSSNYSIIYDNNLNIIFKKNK